MKKLNKILLGAVMAGSLLVLAGCVVTSVHPFYTSKDLTTDPGLVGRWAEAKTENPDMKHWQFEAGAGPAYKLFVQEDAERTEYVAHLFQLKGKRFIDAIPAREPGDFIPPHYLLHVTRLDASGLELSVLDYKWLTELVQEKPKTIRHVWVAEKDGKSRLVLTADTAELQAFVLKHVTNTNAFVPAFVLQRR